MAVIHIEDLEVFAHHGVLDEERRLGGRFLFDIRVFLARCPAEGNDSLEDTVDYGQIAALVEAVALSNSFKLLERLAGAVADAIMAGFPVDGVTVRVAKLAVPIPQRVGRAAVTVERVRAGLEP